MAAPSGAANLLHGGFVHRSELLSSRSCEQLVIQWRQLKLPPAVHALAKRAREGQRPFAMLASELRPEPRLMPAGRAQRSTGVAERAGGVPTVHLGAVA